MTQQAHEEEKKRMITLLRKEYGDDVWLCSTKCGACNAYTQYTDIETVVDYLLSNGAMMLPCKVGDTVYTMWYRPISKEWFVQSSVVIGITFMKRDWFVETDDNNLHLFGSLLNKDWFTDHEAAEQALKERDA